MPPVDCWSLITSRSRNSRIKAGGSGRSGHNGYVKIQQRPCRATMWRRCAQAVATESKGPIENNKKNRFSMEELIVVPFGVCNIVGLRN